MIIIKRDQAAKKKTFAFLAAGKRNVRRAFFCSPIGSNGFLFIVIFTVQFIPLTLFTFSSQLAMPGVDSSSYVEHANICPPLLRRAHLSSQDALFTVYMVVLFFCHDQSAERFCHNTRIECTVIAESSKRKEA